MTSSHVQYSVQIPDNQLQIFPQEQQQTYGSQPAQKYRYSSNGNFDKPSCV